MQRKSISGPHQHACWSEAAQTTCRKLSQKYEFPEIKESTPLLLGTFKLLSQLYPKAIGKTNTVFQIAHKDEKVMVTPDLMENFTAIKKALDG